MTRQFSIAALEATFYSMERAERAALYAFLAGIGVAMLAVAGPLAFDVPRAVWQVIFVIGALITIGSAGFLIYEYREFARNKRLIPLLSIVVCGLGFIVFGGYYFWPFLAPEGPRIGEASEKHAESPKSLHDLYKSDFSNFEKLSNDVTAQIIQSDGTFANNISFGASIYFDYVANSKFYSFYIPKSPDNQSFNLCTHLAKEYPSIIKKLSDSVLSSLKARPSEPSIPSVDLTFSGRIYLYQEDELNFRQKAELEDLFKENGARMIFRGLDYLQERWIEDTADKKASRIAP